MEFTALHILWLISAFTLTTQEMLKLNVSPRITAECGQQVTLQCNASSPNGLSIVHMKWYRSETPLCSVNSMGEISENNPLSDVHCEYTGGQLSIIFKKLQPLETGDSVQYTCKVRSNKGVKHANTTVELQECAQIAEASSERDSPACTFTNVHPDGEVHWFHGSHNLSDGSIKHNTTKRVDEGGWLIIHSELKEGKMCSDVPYNCSLKSSRSGKYIASAKVLVRRSRVRPVLSQSCGARSVRTCVFLLCVSILLTVMLK
ncbi:hypothetical protein INR49_023496 [Caranx melampygus]|nr:hypothetical protein INR49_023496 [Caranx melampygus]